MALLYKAGKFKSKQLNIFLVWLLTKLLKKAKNIFLFDNFWIYFDTNYNSVYLNLLRRKQQQKLNNTNQSRVVNFWRVKNVESINIDIFKNKLIKYWNNTNLLYIKSTIFNFFQCFLSKSVHSNRILRALLIFWLTIFCLH